MKKTIIIANILLFSVIIYLVLHTNIDVDVHLDDTFSPFSRKHIFGTDNMGRDVFSLIVVGGVRTLQVLFITTGIAFIIGTILGLISGYYEKYIGSTIRFIIDFCMIVPSLVSAMIITAIFGITPLTAGLALGLFGMGNYLNQTDNLTRLEKHKEYIVASIMLGVPNIVIIFRRILPNIIKELYVNLGNTASGVIIAYASLTFIGLGADFTHPDWGTMLYEYRIYATTHTSLISIPTLCIFWIALSLNLIFENMEG